MRYNIKRLFNEVRVYELQLERLQEGGKKFNRLDAWSPEINRLQHAKAQCLRYIGEEVVARWKEGKNLNSEIETVNLDI